MIFQDTDCNEWANETSFADDIVGNSPRILANKTRTNKSSPTRHACVDKNRPLSVEVHPTSVKIERISFRIYRGMWQNDFIWLRIVGKSILFSVAQAITPSLLVAAELVSNNKASWSVFWRELRTIIVARINIAVSMRPWPWAGDA